MTEDILMLLNYLEIDNLIHLIDYNIDDMIAYAFALRHSFRVMSVVWDECSLSETVVYQINKTARAVQQFHFIFHSVLNLSKVLIAGRERIYLNHFFFKLIYNAAAILFVNLNHYAEMYSQFKVMRCAFEIYRVFEVDAQENRHWINKYEKSEVSAMALSGDKSAHKDEVLKMFSEIHE